MMSIRDRIAGDQFGVINNADNINNINVAYGDQTDWLAIGQRELAEEYYPAAIEAFEKALHQDRRDEERAAAYCYTALAKLARVRPAYRPPAEIDHVVMCLSNAQKMPLAGFLAALVQEDWYQADSMSEPRPLGRIADRGAVARLNADEVRLVTKHLVPTPGVTWRLLVERAAELDIEVLEHETGGPQVRVPDDERRIGVRRYFKELPPRPDDVPIRTTVALLIGGPLSGATAIAIATSSIAMAARVAIVVAALVVAAVAVVVGMILYQDVRVYRRKLAIYEEGQEIAAMRPSDAQLDEWLRQDVERIQAEGAQRHRLDPGSQDRGGDLLAEPQTVVGVSRLRQKRAEYRRVQDGPLRHAYRIVRTQTNTLVARSRVGADGKIRSDHYHVLVTYLSKHRVCVYRCELDFATGRATSHATQAFHYADVVAISSHTISSRKEIDEAGRMLFDDGSGQYQETFLDQSFVLSLLDGDKIQVGVGVSDGHDDHGRLQMAWKNGQVQRIIERMVWSRKEKEQHR
ncbi:hypothetical protein [Dactylosporangium darangshiense]|uniref:Tetratricopeptide repeat protein n=1 Tax=Dactylosporangium darangshiense TaxID=579108 RepID=A0ABP8DT88_9ACTN